LSHNAGNRAEKDKKVKFFACDCLVEIPSAFYFGSDGRIPSIMGKFEKSSILLLSASPKMRNSMIVFLEP
jgi:hypothetical protein